MIVGEQMTSWSVSPDGQRIRLGFAANGGTESAIELPLDAIAALLPTLPRIIEAALGRRGDPNARLVYPLSQWRVEQSPTPGLMILTLSTPDGFSLSFAASEDSLAAIGAPAPPRVLN